MFICRSCGKFSKKAVEQKEKKVCPKCGWDFTKTVQGPEPMAAKTTADVPGTVALHPGFGGVIDMQANKDYGPSKSFHGKLDQKFILSYPSTIDVPGSDFHHILPTQDLVSRNIVARKIEEIKEMKYEGLMPEVVVGKEAQMKGLALSYDGHHTFVAALKLGSPIVLMLGGGLMNGALPNWKGCTYVDKFPNEKDPNAEEFTFMPAPPLGWPH